MQRQDGGVILIRLNTAQRLALNLDSHVVIDAGAGTGKTSTIVDRVIEHYLATDQRATRLLPNPARPSSTGGGVVTAPASERINLEEWGGLLPGEVVLLTFTNRAADEMKDRLRSAISRIRPGPLGDDGNHRFDPRVKSQGFVEQLLTLLEDAPIGTIDSFLSQLVFPYRGKLGDALSRENVSDASRAILVETALRTIWRLASERNRIGDAVDAGIPAHIASEVLSARDRVARHYAGRTSAARVLRTLVGKAVFVEESSRKIMDETGSFDSNKLLSTIMSSVDKEEISNQSQRLHSIVSDICETIKESLQSPSAAGWSSETRMASLDELDRIGPPPGEWDKLCWMGHVLTCIVSPSTLMGKEMKFFPRMKLPSDSWPAGVRSYSEIKDKNLKSSHTSTMKSKISELQRIWSDDLGTMMLHFVRTAIILDESKPPEVPPAWEPPSNALPTEIPERLDNPKKNHHFSLEAEIQNLRDLHLLHLGFQGVMKNLKQRDEVHDFDDIQRLAGDLLLANCPEICRTFYHPSVQMELDSISPDSPWRDDHISRAMDAISKLELEPESAGAWASKLGAIRADLESRRQLLEEIRRRYRAFIIDEAQDNSPLQWRLLSRLWGPREVREGDPPKPDTPWEPTVCYVGDVKQSIYAFRQAEVTGFLDFAKSLRSINVHEFSSVPELTRKPTLRKEAHSRDPRNDHKSNIATASEYMHRGGRDLSAWIPFDSTDWDLPAPSGREVRARKEGMISLQVNYRSEGGLLEVMNEWWEDVFSDRHRLVSIGEFYASSQTLHSFPEKRKNPGSIEWICPPDSDGSTDPATDIRVHLDPFGPGSLDRLERQAMLIALRVRSLIEGSSVRVRSADNSWNAVPPEDTVRPEEITILLPNRVNLRDVIIRHLHDLGVPTQVDREGGLLERPVAAALEGLVQLVARPRSRHNAAWVIRSPLFGMADTQLHDFLSNSEKGEDLLSRLQSNCSNDRQRSLVSRWRELSSSSLVELLEDTIDRSDLLVAYPDKVSRQDAEQFVDLIRTLTAEVGGDCIVLSDRLRDLRESSSQAIEASTTPPTNAVKVMTIHSSKGLEAKVVILADLFSPRQTNMRNEQNSRLIVSPEMFSGHPNPWPAEGKTPRSAIWEHVSLLHRARKNAEARRLLYVAATRAEEKIIIAGSPRGTQWLEEEGIMLPWTYDKTAPQLGQMWLESLRMGSWRRGETESPWLDSSEADSKPVLANGGSRTIDPGSLLEDAFLGGTGKTGITMIHHPDCFPETNEDGNAIMTPIQRIESIDQASRGNQTTDPPEPSPPRTESSTRVRVKPSKLPGYFECPRCHWLEVRAGVEPDSMFARSGEAGTTKPVLSVDPATFGNIFHRIIEIGIGNPGPGENDPSTALPSSWTTKTEDRITDEDIHRTVFSELLPPDADADKVSEATMTMAQRVSDGRLGEMIRGSEFDGMRVEGLRTEMPFHLSMPVSFEAVRRGKWSPDGVEDLVTIDSTTMDMSGVIDLVLCTSNVNGKPTIRAIDLKTTDAHCLLDESQSRLLEALGDETIGPSCEGEEELLRKHRLQMALYHKALEESESDRSSEGLPSRQVLPPAILVGITGRLVEYPQELLEEAKADLIETLSRTARMSLASDFPISEIEKFQRASNQGCKTCSSSDIAQ
ncbi:MAG: UvrD-helicase domain-containing protein [Candidatus Thalassarchaeaceae archaeon]